jgi:hypothetical protein
LLSALVFSRLAHGHDSEYHRLLLQKSSSNQLGPGQRRHPVRSLHLQLCPSSCTVLVLRTRISNIRYEPIIDVNELITLEDVMNEYQLGPNGGSHFFVRPSFRAQRSWLYSTGVSSEGTR